MNGYLLTSREAADRLGWRVSRFLYLANRERIEPLRLGPIRTWRLEDVERLSSAPVRPWRRRAEGLA